jgi:hypothetical protein
VFGAFPETIAQKGSSVESQIILPEITIEGSADSASVTAADWWANGFVAGYNAPEATLERPLMINDELAAVFFVGAASGQQAALEAQAEFDEQLRDQPQLGPDIRGESLEKVRRRFAEDFGSLFGLHGHMPHTEIESETLEPLPAPNVTLVE